MLSAPVFIVLLLAGASGGVHAPAVASLLAADSAFSAIAAARGMDTALQQFLADDAIMPLPGGRFARGPAEIRQALDRTPLSNGSVSWTPLRAGISADGTHGFTFGYLTLIRPDTAPAYGKYMTYWELQESVWRVRAYKRAPADSIEHDVQLAPSLPGAPPGPADRVQREEDRRSLAAAEAAFSAAAQRIGLAAAFTRFGHDDAVNMGPPRRGFIVGAAQIGAAVGGNTPDDSSPVAWSADYEVIVSPSGDLGVTFGFIRPNPPADSAPGSAFFTVWRRPDRAAPWRYIAE